MIKLEHTVTPSAKEMIFVIEGMRNPMNSWDQSDSYIGFDCATCGHIDRNGSCKPGDPERENCWKYYGLEFGPKDHSLMLKLAKAGSDHRKYLRQMSVMVRITAPLYWWKEFDTYKVGTVRNSCSTMHKIHAKEFTIDDFSHDHLLEGAGIGLEALIDFLNTARDIYVNGVEGVEPKDKRAWWQIIQMLPSSYNQTANVTLNYEVLVNIYRARRNHKLDEWHDFCKWIESLPYSDLILAAAGVGEPKELTLEDLREQARNLGYRVTKREKWISFIPCECGYNKRTHSLDDNGDHRFRCMKCGRTVSGTTEREARIKWNSIMGGKSNKNE